MRHRKFKNQLNRYTTWRKATIISLVKSLLKYQSIRTTLNRAKAARPLAEKLIALAKANTLADKRQAYSILSEHGLVKYLFDEIGPRFKDRASGFVRILHWGVRRGDNAQLVIFELTEIKQKDKKEKDKAKVKEAKPHPVKEEAIEEAQVQEAKPAKEKTKPVETGKQKKETEPEEKEKTTKTKKPSKKFLGGIRNIFKKERDSL